MHSKHEQKICPRCTQPFECKVGDVANCQCHGFKFGNDAKDLIGKKYDDCLCHNCLTQLSNKQDLFKEKFGHSPH